MLRITNQKEIDRFKKIFKRQEKRQEKRKKRESPEKAARLRELKIIQHVKMLKEKFGF